MDGIGWLDGWDGMDRVGCNRMVGLNRMIGWMGVGWDGMG